MKIRMKLLLSVILGIIFLICVTQGISIASEVSQTIAGLSRDEALKLGERMYREGFLPSGDPMPAVVQGDIPVDSTIFSCVSCHLRSGLGSLEGQVVTYPIDGITLYKPITNAWNMRWAYGWRYARSMTGELRSAYNDESLATAIRGGVNPDGKPLNYTMPRYPLNDRDMAIMVYYLKNLSVKPSPGIGGNTMRFATVITDGVGKEDEDAMMNPLKTMEGVSRSGNLSKMARLTRSADPEDLMNKGYINVSLSTWKLKGPTETWREQLDDYYRKDPVFALVGGISKGDWSPVHKFCEDENIPCILPIVDLPVVSTSDWYTVYLSKGLYQEGEAAAQYLRSKEGIEGSTIIEVFRDDTQGHAFADAVDEVLGNISGVRIDKRILTGNGAPTEAFWSQLAESQENSVVLVWLDSKDIAGLSALTSGPDKPKMIFLSSTMIGEGMFNMPEKLRKSVYITFPYRMPDDFLRYQPFLPGEEGRNLTLKDYTIIRNKANLSVMLLTKSIFMLKGYFVRDRFLEVIDMMKDEVMLPLYLRVSFGPGQRYLSKGCYIIQLGEGSKPKVKAVSPWIIQ